MTSSPASSSPAAPSGTPLTPLKPPGAIAGIWTVARNEWITSWSSPLAPVFLAIFLLLTGMLTFTLGNFFGRNQADLASLFQYTPWLMGLMIPALAMRSWSEERALGTLELWLSLPLSTPQLVLGKYLGTLGIVMVALLGTTTFWITVSLLGSPDHLAIIAGYLGLILLGTAFLALSQWLSLLTRSQTVAFVLSAGLCFALNSLGTTLILSIAQNWIPDHVAVFIASLSTLRHLQPFVGGLITLTDIVYFVSLTGLGLILLCLQIDEARRGGRS